MSRTGLRLVACVIFAACIAVVLTIPTPVAPTELPPLVGSTNAGPRLIARARRLAQGAPDDPTTRAFEGAMVRAGQRERQGGVTETTLDDESREFERLRASLVERHGEGVFEALRARARVRFVDADPMRALASPSRFPELGTFAAGLERWGVVRDGRLVAPVLVLHALHAARWNVVARLPRTSGLSRDELVAYHGWLALHAPDVPAELRASAAREYTERISRRSAQEVAGTLAFATGDPETAAVTLRAAAEGSRDLRLRNLALGAVLSE